MVSKTKLNAVFWEMLGEMYEVCEPPLDLEKFKRDIMNGEQKCPEGWFREHVISEQVYDDIKEKYRTKYKLTKRDMTAMSWGLLNWSPMLAEDTDD